MVHDKSNKFTPCPCFLADEESDFQKIVDIDVGVIIYRRRLQKSLNKRTQDLLILENTNNEEINPLDVVTVIDPEKIQCSRCKKVYERVQKVLLKILEIRKQDVISLCDHCLSAEIPRNVCNECAETVRQFISTRSEIKPTQLSPQQWSAKYAKNSPTRSVPKTKYQLEMGWMDGKSDTKDRYRIYSKSQIYFRPQTIRPSHIQDVEAKEERPNFLNEVNKDDTQQRQDLSEDFSLKRLITKIKSTGPDYRPNKDHGYVGNMTNFKLTLAKETDDLKMSVPLEDAIKIKTPDSSPRKRNKEIFTTHESIKIQKKLKRGFHARGFAVTGDDNDLEDFNSLSIIEHPSTAHQSSDDIVEPLHHKDVIQETEIIKRRRGTQRKIEHAEKNGLEKTTTSTSLPAKLSSDLSTLSEITEKFLKPDCSYFFPKKPRKDKKIQMQAVVSSKELIKETQAKIERTKRENDKLMREKEEKHKEELRRKKAEEKRVLEIEQKNILEDNAAGYMNKLPGDIKRKQNAKEIIGKDENEKNNSENLKKQKEDDAKRSKEKNKNQMLQTDETDKNILKHPGQQKKQEEIESIAKEGGKRKAKEAEDRNAKGKETKYKEDSAKMIKNKVSKEPDHKTQSAKTKMKQTDETDMNLSEKVEQQRRQEEIERNAKEAGDRKAKKARDSKAKKSEDHYAKGAERKYTEGDPEDPEAKRIYKEEDPAKIKYKGTKEPDHETQSRKDETDKKLFGQMGQQKKQEKIEKKYKEEAAENNIKNKSSNEHDIQTKAAENNIKNKSSNEHDIQTKANQDKHIKEYDRKQIQVRQPSTDNLNLKLINETKDSKKHPEVIPKKIKYKGTKEPDHETQSRKDETDKKLFEQMGQQRKDETDKKIFEQMGQQKKQEEIERKYKEEAAENNIKNKSSNEHDIQTKATQDKHIKEYDRKQIQVRQPSTDNLILKLINETKDSKKHPEVIPKIQNIPILTRRRKRSTNVSDSQFDSETLIPHENLDEISQIIIGDKIFRYNPRLAIKQKEEEQMMPISFKSELVEEYLDADKSFLPTEPTLVPEKIKRHEALHKTLQTDAEESPKAVLRYMLSDRTFIDKGWTMLPVEKVVRKMNVYKMRPAKPEFDWFEHNKKKGLLTYDSGETLAKFEDDGRCRLHYKNGRVALDYYEAEETNAGQRFVLYSSGEPDGDGRSRPLTVLAMFDHLGNGVVFDHKGKIRLKYNQTEGVVLDRSLGPPSRWKWHSLNDPPVLQQVMIDTHLPQKDPRIAQFRGPDDSNRTRQDNEEMLAIEFDNFIKEKSKKLSQEFKPFQIRMKVLKINEQFSLRVLDQATVYLQFRDGSTNVKQNIGMVLDHKEIVDTDTADVGDVASAMEQFPARTPSVAVLQCSVARARLVERVSLQHQRYVRPPAPALSADQLTASVSKPLRPPIHVAPSEATSATATIYKCRKQPPNLYYDTRLF